MLRLGRRAGMRMMREASHAGNRPHHPRVARPGESPHMADIVLINPRFEVSYWGMEHALPFLGKRANMPVACLPLLAALTPEGHTVTLIDENVEAIDFDRCARADIVGVTGMSVQRHRMKEILAELKQRGMLHGRRRAAGHRPGRLLRGAGRRHLHRRGRGDLAAVPRGVEAGPAPGPLRAGREVGHDARCPTPRFDLLKMRHYAFGSVQFSRGCPFQCEFCDIIVTFGRRPRIKTPRADRRGDRRALRRGDADRLHRRRQPDRQQEGDQGRPARRDRLAAASTAIRSPSSPRRRSTWPTTPS